MKIFLIFILFILLLPLSGSSQQIYRKGNHIQWLSDYTFTYEMRFHTESFSMFTFDKKTDFYRSRKVKMVEVLTKDSIPLWRLRLNADGTILNTGYLAGGFFTEYEEKNLGEKEMIKVTKYFEKNILVRVDSIFYFARQYTNEDTLLEVSFSRQENYRIGYLINHRNNYYNEHYLRKPIDYESMVTVYFPLNFYGKELADPPNYYDEPFKVDYDSLRMYHCAFVSQTQNTHGYHLSDNSYIDLENLNHPFLRTGNVCKTEYYTDGSDFHEPSFYQPGIFCSVYPNNYFPMDNGYRTGYHYNESGLITEYYNDYYPEDTAATRIVRLEREKQQENKTEDNNAIPVSYTLMLPEKPIVIRSKTPKRIDTYFYQYEFFE